MTLLVEQRKKEWELRVNGKCFTVPLQMYLCEETRLKHACSFTQAHFTTEFLSLSQLRWHSALAFIVTVACRQTFHPWQVWHIFFNRPRNWNLTMLWPHWNPAIELIYLSRSDPPSDKARAAQWIVERRPRMKAKTGSHASDPPTLNPLKKTYPTV